MQNLMDLIDHKRTTLEEKEDNFEVSAVSFQDFGNLHIREDRVILKRCVADKHKKSKKDKVKVICFLLALKLLLKKQLS